MESEVEPDPYDGYLLTYTNPITGGPTLPTFACELQLLTPNLNDPGPPPHQHDDLPGLQRPGRDRCRGRPCSSGPRATSSSSRRGRGTPRE